MFKKFCGLVLLCACSSEDESGKCVFDGHYEMGLISRTDGCNSVSEQIYANNEEDECSVTIDQIGLSGAHQKGMISCPSGDPVGECEGFIYDSDDCSFDVYLRKLAE